MQDGQMNKHKRVVRRGAEKASHALYFARKHKEQGSRNDAKVDSKVLLDSYQTHVDAECFSSMFICLRAMAVCMSHPELSVRLCALGL